MSDNAEQMLQIILNRIENIDARLSHLDNRFSALDMRITALDNRINSIDGRLARIEDDMRKVLKCVNHENADFNPMAGAQRSPEQVGV